MSNITEIIINNKDAITIPAILTALTVAEIRDGIRFMSKKLWKLIKVPFSKREKILYTSSIKDKTVSKIDKTYSDTTTYESYSEINFGIFKKYWKKTKKKIKNINNGKDDSSK